MCALSMSAGRPKRGAEANCIPGNVAGLVVSRQSKPFTVPCPLHAAGFLWHAPSVGFAALLWQVQQEVDLNGIDPVAEG